MESHIHIKGSSVTFGNLQFSGMSWVDPSRLLLLLCEVGQRESPSLRVSVTLAHYLLDKMGAVCGRHFHGLIQFLAALGSPDLNGCKHN